jgi:hypothetical protein
VYVVSAAGLHLLTHNTESTKHSSGSSSVMPLQLRGMTAGSRLAGNAPEYHVGVLIRHHGIGPATHEVCSGALICAVLHQTCIRTLAPAGCGLMLLTSSSACCTHMLLRGTCILAGCGVLLIAGSVSPALAGLALTCALDLTRFLKYGTEVRWGLQKQGCIERQNCTAPNLQSLQVGRLRPVTSVTADVAMSVSGHGADGHVELLPS